MGREDAPNWVCGDGGVLIGPRGAGMQAGREEEEGGGGGKEFSFSTQTAVVKDADLWFSSSTSEEILLK